MIHSRNTTLITSARLTIMQTALKTVSHDITLYLCPLIVSVLLHPLTSLHHCFIHSKFWILYIHHRSSVPGKSQDDVRLHPALPYRPASCYFGSCKLNVVFFPLFGFLFFSVDLDHITNYYAINFISFSPYPILVNYYGSLFQNSHHCFFLCPVVFDRCLSHPECNIRALILSWPEDTIPSTWMGLWVPVILAQLHR